jgi:hypothetical protein
MQTKSGAAWELNQCGFCAYVLHASHSYAGLSFGLSARLEAVVDASGLTDKVLQVLPVCPPQVRSGWRRADLQVVRRPDPNGVCVGLGASCCLEHHASGLNCSFQAPVRAGLHPVARARWRTPSGLRSAACSHLCAPTSRAPCCRPPPLLQVQQQLAGFLPEVAAPEEHERVVEALLG